MRFALLAAERSKGVGFVFAEKRSFPPSRPMSLPWRLNPGTLEVNLLHSLYMENEASEVYLFPVLFSGALSSPVPTLCRRDIVFVCWCNLNGKLHTNRRGSIPPNTRQGTGNAEMNHGLTATKQSVPAVDCMIFFLSTALSTDKVNAHGLGQRTSFILVSVVILSPLLITPSECAHCLCSRRWAT